MAPGDKVVYKFIVWLGNNKSGAKRREMEVEATVVSVKGKMAKILFTERNIEKTVPLTKLRLKGSV